MRRPILLILIAVACVLPCNAQTRWCSVTGRGPQDTIVYPPIARAARVSGVVMGYLKFTPDGKVTKFEPIQGPFMLRETLKTQFASWTLQTEAKGADLCQALVVASFQFTDRKGCSGCSQLRPPSCDRPPTPAPADCLKFTVGFEPSILRLHFEAPQPCEEWVALAAQSSPH
jgi:hypothetical protein